MAGPHAKDFFVPVKAFESIFRAKFLGQFKPQVPITRLSSTPKLRGGSLQVAELQSLLRAILIKSLCNVSER